MVHLFFILQESETCLKNRYTGKVSQLLCVTTLGLMSLDVELENKQLKDEHRDMRRNIIVLKAECSRMSRIRGELEKGVDKLWRLWKAMDDENRVLWSNLKGLEYEKRKLQRRVRDLEDRNLYLRREVRELRRGKTR